MSDHNPKEPNINSLSLDLTQLIFSSLPLPSLLRASAVCKLWNSLISSPSFTSPCLSYPWFFLFGLHNTSSRNNQSFAFDPLSNAWFLLPRLDDPSSSSAFLGSNGFFFTTTPNFSYTPVLKSAWRFTSPLKFSILPFAPQAPPQDHAKMKFAVVCVLALAVLVAAADTKDERIPEKGTGAKATAPAGGDAKAAGSDALKKRMAAVGVKDLDLKKLSGKWFNVAGSAAITKDFIRTCTCNELNFKQIGDDKLHVIALCRNVEQKKINSVNGTLTQVQPQTNKGLFHLAFTEKKGDIKGVKVNKTEAEEVKKQVQGKASDADKNVIGKGGETEAKAKDLSVNAVVLKADDKHVLMASPALDAAWILARDRKFDDKLFNEYKSFLEGNGFTTTKLTKIDHSNCQGDLMKDLIKGKSMPEGEGDKSSAKH